MPSKERYLQNPCRYSSIPYWKVLRTTVPDGMKILHEDEFHIGLSEQYHDESYFRLRHDLLVLAKEKVPAGYTLCQATEEEYACHIRECYGNGMTADQVHSFTEREGYCPLLWIAIRHDETGKIVATGIAELDREVGEGILEWIQVSKEHRAKGLGRFLVLELLWRMKQKADFATVSGRCNNPDQPEKLYRKCGFTGNDVWHILRKR